jgi:signal transduction histidine kinase
MAMAHSFAKRVLQGAVVTHAPSRRAEPSIVVRHLNYWIHSVWACITFFVFPLEFRPSAPAGSAVARQTMMGAMVFVCSAHLLSWRSNVPRMSIQTHTWIMMSYGFAALTIGLFLNGGVGGTQQYIMGLVPLSALHFISVNAARVTLAACLAVLVVLYILLERGVSFALDNSAPTRESLLYGGPLVWAFYTLGTMHARGLVKELQRSNEALSDALSAARRAVREKEGLMRFLCHELRSPLNCVALGFDELATSGSGAADRDTVSIVRNQIQSMHSCLDDLMLVVGSSSTTAESEPARAAAVARTEQQ